MNLLMPSFNSGELKLIGQFIDLILVSCEVPERVARQERSGSVGLGGNIFFT